MKILSERCDMIAWFLSESISVHRTSFLQEFWCVFCLVVSWIHTKCQANVLWFCIRLSNG